MKFEYAWLLFLQVLTTLWLVIAPPVPNYIIAPLVFMTMIVGFMVWQRIQNALIPHDQTPRAKRTAHEKQKQIIILKQIETLQQTRMNEIAEITAKVKDITEAQTEDSTRIADSLSKSERLAKKLSRSLDDNLEPSQQENLDNFGKIKFTTHKQLQFLESSEFSPVKFFIEPIGISLNYLDENFDFDSYYMVGISGGGWTTVLFSAIDDRISQSYSVAGTFPIFMRSDTKNVGDYEQIVPELYSIANYLELYIMGSYGSERKLVLIYNEFDPCCFPGELYEKYPYLEVVSQKLNLLGNGEFDVIIDKSSK